MVTTQKDANTAFLIELVGGLFGFLGLGYMYVGRTNEGIIRLIVFLAYNLIAWFVIVALVFVAIGCFCAPVQLLIQLGVAAFSAYQLKTSMTTGIPMAPAFAPSTPPTPTSPQMPQPTFSSQSPAPSVPQPAVTPPPAPPVTEELPPTVPPSSRDWPPPAPLPLEDAPAEPQPLPSEEMPAQPPPAEDTPAQQTPPPDADKPVDPTA